MSTCERPVNIFQALVYKKKLIAGFCHCKIQNYYMNLSMSNKYAIVVYLQKSAKCNIIGITIQQTKYICRITGMPTFLCFILSNNKCFGFYKIIFQI